MFWFVIVIEIIAFLWLLRLVYKNWNTHFKEVKGTILCTIIALPLLIIAQLVTY